MITLAPHQQAAITAVLSDYLFDGRTRVVVQMATGAGKTITAAALASSLFTGEAPVLSGRILFLAHREELLTQARDAFAHFFPEKMLGIVQGERDLFAAPIVFASVQTLSQSKRLQNVLRYGPFSLVICDECHHATASTYRRLLGTVKQPETPVMADEALLVGLTATPLRSDNVSLRIVFEQLSYSVGILELMTLEPDPWLVDLKGITIELPDLSFDVDEDDLDTDGDYTQAQIDKAIAAGIKKQTRYQYILDVLTRYPEVGQLQGIYFGANRSDAYGFADYATAAGIPTETITGTTLDEEREAIYARFRSGETRYISNMNVLPEGVDLPMAKVAIIGRHTRFIGRYVQMVGRITRIHPDDRGKPYSVWRYPTGYILDLADNQHTVITLPEMVGTTEEKAKGKSVRELAKEKAIEAQPEPKVPVYRPGSELRVAAGSLFTSRLWRASGQDYKLTTPHGTYVAHYTGKNLRSEGIYDTLFYAKDTGKMRRLTSRGPVPLEKAFGFGEQHLQAAEYREEKRTDPAVRARPASPSQLAAVRKVFTFIKPEWRLTQGAVQDLWDGLKTAGGVGHWHKSPLKGQWYARHRPR